MREILLKIERATGFVMFGLERTPAHLSIVDIQTIQNEKGHVAFTVFS
jgi:hypothetical protein